MASERKERFCLECGHDESKHFASAIGSFCGQCGPDNPTWEHVFKAQDSPFPTREQELEQALRETIKLLTLACACKVNLERLLGGKR